MFDEDLDGKKLREIFNAGPIAEEDIESDQEQELIEDDLNEVEHDLTWKQLFKLKTYQGFFYLSSRCYNF